MTPIDPIVFKPEPRKPNSPIEVHSFASEASPTAGLTAMKPQSSKKASKKSAAPAKKAARKK